MSRKLTLAVAAIALLGSAALVTAPANAKPGKGGNAHSHHHGHINFKRIYISGRYYVRPVSYVAPVRIAGPCTCLTKEYTPEGVAVFKDLCTKEMASAALNNTDVAQAEPQNN